MALTKFRRPSREGYKICRRCDVELPVENFRLRKGRNSKIVRESRCLPCEALDAKERRLAAPEKEKQKQIRFRERHLESIRARQRELYRANLEKSRAAAKIKRERQISKPGYRDTYNAQQRARRKGDPLHRLGCILRHRTGTCLKQGKFSKNLHLWEYLGCSAEELKKYVESLWQPGMTWDNFGKNWGQWSLDHTDPIGIATTEKDIYRLSHYTNLKPMWAHYNTVKNSKSPQEWEVFKAQFKLDESVNPYIT